MSSSVSFLVTVIERCLLQTHVLSRPAWLDPRAPGWHILPFQFILANSRVQAGGAEVITASP